MPEKSSAFPEAAGCRPSGQTRASTNSGISNGNDLFKELKGRRTKLRLADVAAMIGNEIEHAEGRRIELGDIVKR